MKKEKKTDEKGNRKEKHLPLVSQLTVFFLEGGRHLYQLVDTVVAPHGLDGHCPFADVPTPNESGWVVDAGEQVRFVALKWHQFRTAVCPKVAVDGQLVDEVSKCPSRRFEHAGSKWGSVYWT